MTDSQREKKNRLNRERYAWLKEHGICVDCGHENAAKGKSRCLVCLSVKNELSIKSHRKDIEKTRELHKQNACKLRQRRKESGLKDIDGYVSKDSLYRLMSKLRLQDSIITEEQANVICNIIAEMPDELEDEDDDQ